ncbi:hypothetical protein KD288_002394 [Salmonella enterica]|nr:hypothetical protein [Salmonella enterica]
MSKFTFHDYTLKAHSIDGQTWFESADVAKALGYAHVRSITGLYANYTKEFSEGMTLIIDSTTNGINNSLRKIKVRLFSLRGVHLIAMLSRTPVAEDFRKWVLDLIEREEARQKQIPVDNRRGPYRNNSGELPPGVYHNQSKYNPYRATTSVNGKFVHIGCFPTVDDAVNGIDNYYRTGAVQRLKAAKKIDVMPVPTVFPDKKQELIEPGGVDFVAHMATFLEAAQLLSCYKFGKELAWDLVAFAQEESQRAKLRI